MRLKQTGLAIIMLSLLSNLFGCGSSATKGPDFNDRLTKVFHIKPGVQVTYELPGNMSTTMNFAERYKAESPRTSTLDMGDTKGFETDEWRSSRYIDGAMWDYIGPRNKGLGGERGKLNIRISLDMLPKGESMDNFVVGAYDVFLNGPDGLNTAVRKGETGDEDISDEELGNWIIEAPMKLETQVLGGTEFKHFTVSWRGASVYHYYCKQLSEERFLSFMFRYTVKANDDDERAEQENAVLRDIQSILDSIAFH